MSKKHARLSRAALTADAAGRTVNALSSAEAAAVGLVEAELLSEAFCRRLQEALAHHGVSAGEVLSETYLRLRQVSVARKFDPARGSVLQFAVGVSQRVRMEINRRARRGTGATGLDDLGDQVVSREPGPVQRAVDRDDWCATVRAMDTLPGPVRELIRRRFGVCLDARDGFPATRAEHCRLCRALKKLRARLESVT